MYFFERPAFVTHYFWLILHQMRPVDNTCLMTGGMILRSIKNSIQEWHIKKLFNISLKPHRFFNISVAKRINQACRHRFALMGISAILTRVTRLFTWRERMEKDLARTLLRRFCNWQVCALDCSPRHICWISESAYGLTEKWFQRIRLFNSLKARKAFSNRCIRRSSNWQRHWPSNISKMSTWMWQLLKWDLEDDWIARISSRRNCLS